MRRLLSAVVFALVLISASDVSAQEIPRYDICADVPQYFGMGASSFSDYGPELIREMNEDEGVDWNHIYLYVGPAGNRTDVDFITYVLAPKLQQAEAIGAMPSITFYNLLRLGRDYSQPAISGDEATVVQSVLKDPALMKEYFADFTYILQETSKIVGPFQMHVEPDSWGFMMWAFGVEGNADATSVEVAVASSGFPGLENFSNDASGFGQALLHLRDLHAPEARMGWHASNFRANTRPEVVSQFYSSMGKWDLLVGEGGPIGSGDWWEDLSDADLLAHMNWHKEVTESAQIPMLNWQQQVGFTDYQFLAATGDNSRMIQYAMSGVIGFEFAINSNGGDINSSRALENGYGDIPPNGHPAGGTVGDMRVRVADYYKNKVAWPEGSMCFGGSNKYRDGNLDPYVPGSGSSGTGGNSSTDAGNGSSESGGNTTDTDGCGCQHGVGTPKPWEAAWIFLGLAVAVSIRRRRS